MASGFCGAVAAHVHLLSFERMEQDGDAAAFALLSDDERAALTRAKAPQRRAELLHGRANLRRVLAYHTGRPPQELLLERDANGKPRLAQCGSGPQPSFGVSHAGDVLAVVVAPSGELGVDVEIANGKLTCDMDAIARRHFSKAEWAVMDAAPANRREAVFFRLWTLKEAVLKSAGIGLFHPLSDIDVAQPVERYRLSLACQDRRLTVEAWHTQLDPGVHLAVAAVGMLDEVAVWDWRCGGDALAGGLQAAGLAALNSMDLAALACGQVSRLKAANNGA